MTYPVEFRRKVLNYVKNGGKVFEALEIYSVSRDTYYRWKRMDEAGNLSDPEPKKAPWRKLDPEKLVEAVKQNPDTTIKDHAKKFGVAQSAVWKVFKKLNIVHKKNKFIQRAQRTKTTRIFRAYCENT